MNDNLLRIAIAQELARKVRTVKDRSKDGLDSVKKYMAGMYSKYNSSFQEKSGNIHSVLKNKLESLQKKASETLQYVPMIQTLDSFSRGFGGSLGGLAGYSALKGQRPLVKIGGGLVGAGLGSYMGDSLVGPSDLKNFSMDRYIEKMEPESVDPFWEMPSAPDRI